MSESDDVDAFIATGTRLIGIAIRPEWSAAIGQHLAIALGHARYVAEFPLADETDPAPVFSP